MYKYVMKYACICIKFEISLLRGEYIIQSSTMLKCNLEVSYVYLDYLLMF